MKARLVLKLFEIYYTQQKWIRNLLNTSAFGRQHKEISISNLLIFTLLGDITLKRFSTGKAFPRKTIGCWIRFSKSTTYFFSNHWSLLTFFNLRGRWLIRNLSQCLQGPDIKDIFQHPINPINILQSWCRKWRLIGFIMK